MEDVLFVWSWLYMPRLCAQSYEAFTAAAMPNFTAHSTAWGLPMTVALVNVTIHTVTTEPTVPCHPARETCAPDPLDCPDAYRPLHGVACLGPSHRMPRSFSACTGLHVCLYGYWASHMVMTPPTTPQQ